MIASTSPSRSPWRLVAAAALCVTAVSGPAWASPADDYQSKLRSLRKNNPQSVPTAVATYTGLFAKDAPTADSDRAFVAFRSFYYTVDLGDPTTLTKPVLKSNGLVMLMSEGMPYAGEDGRFFTSTFRRYVSKPVQAFLDLRETDLREGFSADAGLSIPFSAVGERVSTWEQYLKSYPTSPMKTEAESWLQIYVRTFFSGMDNSPLFDWTSHKLRPEVARAYDFYRNHHPTSRYTKLVQEHLGVISSCGDRDCPARSAFLKRHGIATMMGMQPPTR